MPEQRHIEIPGGVHVSCPLKQFHQRRAVLCEGCDYFSGLQEMLAGDNTPFEHRFMVLCSVPTPRKLCIVEAE